MDVNKEVIVGVKWTILGTLSVAFCNVLKVSIFKFSKYKGPDIEIYKNNCINILQEKGVKLLIFNILEGCPLCEFLVKKVPNCKFPIVT